MSKKVFRTGIYSLLLIILPILFLILNFSGVVLASGKINQTKDMVRLALPSDTTTTVNSLSNTSTYGLEVIFTATVNPIPDGGTVQFQDNAVNMGNPVNVNTSSGLATYTTSSLSANSHSITAIYSGNNNFNSSTSSDFTQMVDRKTITVTADAKSKIYGAADPALTYVASGLVGTDSLSGTLSRAAGENVGAYAITQGTVDNTHNSNYNITYIGSDLTINKAVLTVTADNKSIIYGDAEPANTISYTGWQNGEGPSVLDTSPTAAINGAHTDAGTYTIIPSGGADNNYSFTYVNGTLTVAKRSITVTADAKTKTYGDTDPALTYHITSGSLVGSDAFTGILTRVPGKDAGTYAIQQGTLALNANYDLTYTAANLIISPKPLTVTANAKSKTYGDADPALTYVASGLVGTDSLSGTLSRAAGENVGAYAITQGTVDNAHNSNYNITYTGANLTITKATPAFSNLASLTISYGTVSASLGGNIKAGALIPPGIIDITVNGVTQPVTIDGDGNFSANFDTGTFSGASYPITYSYNGDSNFNSISDNSKTLVVQVESVVVSGGGGGGGGGGGTGSKIYPGGLLVKTPVEIGNNGVILAAAKFTTKDGAVTLDIANKTKLLSNTGNALSILTVDVLASPPDPPASNALVVAYTFGPDGAKFNPPITLTLSYDADTLPKDAQENSLFIAYWDGSQWISLESNVDTATHTISAQISHFSVYSLLGKLTSSTPTPTPALNPVSTPDKVATPPPATIAELLPEPSPTPTPAITPVITDIQEPVTTPHGAKAPTPAQTPPISTLVTIYIFIFIIVTLLTVYFVFRHRRRV